MNDDDFRGDGLCGAFFGVLFGSVCFAVGWLIVQVVTP